MNHELPISEPAEILIAEDSVTQAMVLENILKKRNYRVTFARDGYTALERLKEAPSALVITDIQMPRMDGYELCRAIKSDPEFASIPVILLTSLSAPQDIIRGLESGADNFIVKPYDEEFLLSRVENVLANQRLLATAGAHDGITIFFAGNKYVINSDRRQILNLLLSTYETAIKTNQDLIKTHEELKAAQTQLIEAEKLQMIGRLAAGVAHEVRNPLAILEMGIGILEERPGSQEDSTVLSEMREAVRRANSVITKLVDLSSPHRFGMHDANIDSLVQGALAVLAEELRDQNIKVLTDFATEGWHCTLDAEKMEQVFLNLLANARDAMPAGGTLTVSTRIRQAEKSESPFHAGDRSGERLRVGDHLAIIEIVDNGSGIARDDLSKLFEPFFSTKSTGKGMGLGLTVAKKIVDLHGGWIEVGNAGSRGAKATLMLKTLPDSPK